MSNNQLRANTSDSDVQNNHDAESFAWGNAASVQRSSYGRCTGGIRTISLPVSSSTRDAFVLMRQLWSQTRGTFSGAKFDIHHRDLPNFPVNSAYDAIMSTMTIDNFLINVERGLVTTNLLTSAQINSLRESGQSVSFKVTFTFPDGTIIRSNVKVTSNHGTLYYDSNIINATDEGFSIPIRASQSSIQGRSALPSRAMAQRLFNYFQARSLDIVWVPGSNRLASVCLPNDGVCRIEVTGQ